MNILINNSKERSKFLFYFVWTFTIFCFYGCTDSLKKEEFNLNIVVVKDYSNTQDEVFPPELGKLCSYYKDSISCPTTIYFPKVSINRPDLKQNSVVEIPLDKGDKIRQSVGLLSAKKLKGAFDKAMKDLQPPSFLFLKPVSKFTENELKKEYPNAILYTPSLSYNIDSMKQFIAQKMCLSKLNSDITIIVLDLLNNDISSAIDTKDSTNIVDRPPTPTYPAKGVKVKGEYFCDNKTFIKYEKVHDGKGGFNKGKIITKNSKECGYRTTNNWVSVPPNKCEEGSLYKFEKNTQSGLVRKVKIGNCDDSQPSKLPRLLEENLTIEESKAKTKNTVKPIEVKKQ